MIRQVNNKQVIKLLIIGDSAVGKTNILLRFCEDSYSSNFISTIGISYQNQRDLEVDGKQVYLQIWDTAGQERFKTITQTYYKGAMGIILTYAVNNVESFQNIQNWMNQIKQHAPENVVVMLIANKSDVTERQVSYEQGKNIAETYGIKFYETSAKDGSNIVEAFTCISKQIKDILVLEEQVQIVVLNNKAVQEKKCC